MESTVVATASGRVRGFVRDGVSAYLGVPYAAPPFGAHRFAPPQPVVPWDGVRDVVAYGATAPKPPYPKPYDFLLPDPIIEGEDCLNLNVWTPDPGSAGLPVMVWIHGGAFRNGSGAVDIYDGTAFARDGVVCVTVNYRLGVEGFAYLPGAPANRGLLDQIAALEWVRDNIAAFGGDPGNVTVFGESAGGMSVSTLLSLDLGLFRRAVAQSGAGAVGQSVEDALLVTGEIARRLGVEATAAGFAALEPSAVLPAQASVAAEVAALPDPLRWGASTARNALPLLPVLDGDLLEQLPQDAVAAGAGAGVDLLTGYTSDEFRLFLMPSGLAERMVPELLGPITAGMGVPGGVVDSYQATHPGLTAGELLAMVITDHVFRVPAQRLAGAHGGRTWMYEFAWPSPVPDLGACHALELGFVFDNLHSPDIKGLAGDAPPQALAESMHSAWVSFAATGDPGWAEFDGNSRLVRRFDGAGDPVVAVSADDPEIWG